MFLIIVSGAYFQFPIFSDFIVDKYGVPEGAGSITVGSFLEQNKDIAPGAILFIKDVSNYDQYLSAFGENYATVSIVNDPWNSNIIYLSEEINSWERPDLQTMSDRERRPYGISNIYSLNLKTGESKLIYSSGPSLYRFSITGERDGRRLVLEKMDRMDSTGPCYDIVVSAYENPEADSRVFVSLDPKKPETGLLPHAVAKEEYERSKLDLEKCANGLVGQ